MMKPRGCYFLLCAAMFGSIPSIHTLSRIRKPMPGRTNIGSGGRDYWVPQHTYNSDHASYRTPVYGGGLNSAIDNVTLNLQDTPTQDLGRLDAPYHMKLIFPPVERQKIYRFTPTKADGMAGRNAQEILIMTMRRNVLAQHSRFNALSSQLHAEHEGAVLILSRFAGESQWNFEEIVPFDNEEILRLPIGMSISAKGLITLALEKPITIDFGIGQ